MFIAQFAHQRCDGDAQHIAQETDDHDKGKGHPQFFQLIAAVKGSSAVKGGLPEQRERKGHPEIGASKSVSHFCEKVPMMHNVLFRVFIAQLSVYLLAVGIHLAQTGFFHTAERPGI